MVYKRCTFVYSRAPASTRAVHLEVVPDLSEETFMMTFRRFVSRRSVPQIMMSDNATTFRAAANHLRRLTHNTQACLAVQGTEWKFIPQRAPWYGGWWERLIGITKKTIKKVLGNASIDLHTLQTVVTEVEAIINDRPLTYVSSSRDDPEPLTPSHLLYGKRLTSLPAYDTSDADDIVGRIRTRDDATRRVNQHRRVIDQYWTCWRRDYLTSLRERQQTRGAAEQTIRVGDVVILHDDFSPRLRWNMGVVQELIQDNDGLTRAAHVLTTNGLLTRPIVKLYPLEINDLDI